MKIIKVYRMGKKSTSTVKSATTSKTSVKKNKVKHHSVIDSIHKQLHREQEFYEEFEVPKEARTMPDKITLMEYTRVLLERASQIENGAAHFLTEEEVKNCIASREIAELEIQLRKCPFLIKRYVSNSTYMFELWAVNELILPL